MALQPAESKTKHPNSNGNDVINMLFSNWRGDDRGQKIIGVYVKSKSYLYFNIFNGKDVGLEDWLLPPFGVCSFDEG